MPPTGSAGRTLGLPLGVRPFFPKTSSDSDDDGTRNADSPGDEDSDSEDSHSGTDSDPGDDDDCRTHDCAGTDSVTHTEPGMTAVSSTVGPSAASTTLWSPVSATLTMAEMTGSSSTVTTSASAAGSPTKQASQSGRTDQETRHLELLVAVFGSLALLLVLFIGAIAVYIGMRRWRRRTINSVVEVENSPTALAATLVAMSVSYTGPDQARGRKQRAEFATHATLITGRRADTNDATLASTHVNRTGDFGNTISGRWSAALSVHTDASDETPPSYRLPSYSSQGKGVTWIPV